MQYYGLMEQCGNLCMLYFRVEVHVLSCLTVPHILGHYSTQFFVDLQVREKKLTWGQQVLAINNHKNVALIVLTLLHIIFKFFSLIRFFIASFLIKWFKLRQIFFRFFCFLML